MLTLSKEKSLEKLIEGNKLFCQSKELTYHDLHEKRINTIEKQTPFAAVISCADSRVPPEIIFKQGIGDLFVIRVAGNITNEHILGSIEYAVQSLAVKLIVILGHSNCGAVKAALSGQSGAGYLGQIMTKIRKNLENSQTEDLETAVKANIKQEQKQLSSLLSGLMSEDVKIVSAYYHLESGLVEFDF